MNDQINNLVVGEVYEVDNHIKIDFGHGVDYCHYFVKLIGFSANKQPVFEKAGRFFAINPEYATITAIRKEAA